MYFSTNSINYYEDFLFSTVELKIPALYNVHNCFMYRKKKSLRIEKYLRCVQLKLMN